MGRYYIYVSISETLRDIKPPAGMRSNHVMLPSSDLLVDVDHVAQALPIWIAS